MPILKVQSNTDELTKVDTPKAIAALFRVTVQQLNVLRGKAGLPELTQEEARQSFVKAYREAK